MFNFKRQQAKWRQQDVLAAAQAGATLMQAQDKRILMAEFIYKKQPMVMIMGSGIRAGEIKALATAEHVFTTNRIEIEDNSKAAKKLVTGRERRALQQGAGAALKIMRTDEKQMLLAECDEIFGTPFSVLYAREDKAQMLRARVDELQMLDA